MGSRTHRSRRRPCSVADGGEVRLAVGTEPEGGVLLALQARLHDVGEFPTGVHPVHHTILVGAVGPVFGVVMIGGQRRPVVDQTEQMPHLVQQDRLLGVPAQMADDPIRSALQHADLLQGVGEDHDLAMPPRDPQDRLRPRSDAE